MNNKEQTLSEIVKLTITITTAAVILIFGGWAGCARMDVLTSRWSGEAVLAKQTQTKLIIVQQAKAQAEAEILRAEGVAKANKIIGNSLKDNPLILQLKWLDALAENPSKTLIYIPTSKDGSGIPSLETGRGVSFSETPTTNVGKTQNK